MLQRDGIMTLANYENYKFKPGDIIHGPTHEGNWRVRDIIVTDFTKKYLYGGEKFTLNEMRTEYDIEDAETGLLKEVILTVVIHKHWKALPKLTALVLYGKTAEA